MQYEQQLDEDEIKRLEDEEYNILQSKFRLAELKKSQYSTHLKMIVNKQLRVIDILEKEKENLTTDIQVTESKCYRGVEDKGLTCIYNYIEKEKKLDEKIVKEKSQLKDLKVEIDKVKKEIVSFNKTEIQESKITESVLKSEKRRSLLENNLQVATCKFNMMLTQNAKYREEIEVLLNERKNFFKFYMKMYKQLIYGKQIMLDLVEQATTTYDQREEAYRKLKSLREKTAAETRIQSKDVQELKRKLENCEDLYEFLSVKGQKRILADLEAREAREKKRLADENHGKLHRYQSYLARITLFMNETNIDRIAICYIQKEQENLGLFNYVNDVNDEVEVLQEQISAMLERIDDQRILNEKRLNQQKNNIEKMNANLNEKTALYQQAMRKLNASRMLLNDLLLNLEKMFLQFECDVKPILALLGNNAHVNVFNAHMCLTLLEKQLYEFIYITYAKERLCPPGELEDEAIVQDDYHLLASKRPITYHLASSSPCPLCVETDRIIDLDENSKQDALEEYDNVHTTLMEQFESESMNLLLHNISACRLPRSRAIMQARFQEQEQDR